MIFGYLHRILMEWSKRKFLKRKERGAMCQNNKPNITDEVRESLKTGPRVFYKVLKKGYDGLQSLYRYGSTYPSHGWKESDRPTKELTTEEETNHETRRGIHVFLDESSAIAELDAWPNQVIYQVHGFLDDFVSVGVFDNTGYETAVFMKVFVLGRKRNSKKSGRSS